MFELNLASTISAAFTFCGKYNPKHSYKIGDVVSFEDDVCVYLGDNRWDTLSKVSDISNNDTDEYQIPMKCDCCGAPLIRYGSYVKCEYCGTSYK